MALVPDLSGNRAMNAPVVDRQAANSDFIKKSYPVTLSDSADLPQGVTSAVAAQAAGNIKVTYANGVIDTVPIVAGIWEPMNVKRIWSTGTTATGVSAGY